MRARGLGIAATTAVVVVAGAALALWRRSPSPAGPAAPGPAPASAVVSAAARLDLPDDGGRPWLDDAVDEDPDGARGDVAYDCAGLPFAEPGPPCDDTPTPLSHLVEASENDPSSRPEGPEDADWVLWRDAVRAAGSLDPDSLAIEDRIVAQNAVLR